MARLDLNVSNELKNKWKTYVDNNTVNYSQTIDTTDNNWNIGDLDLDTTDYEFEDITDYSVWRSDKIKEVKKEVEIYREIDPDNVIIITLDRLKDEIGEDISLEDIEERLKYWVMVCVNCGFKDAFPRFWSSPEKLVTQMFTSSGNTIKTNSSSISCPNCGSSAVGIPKENESDLIKEILKGT